MTYNRYLLGLALLVAGTMPTFSQVSDDNEDGVVKMNADRSRYDFVEGQVLVKFKDESPVKVSKARGLVTTNVGQLTSILEKYGANEMDKVLPNEKPGRQLRKSRAFNGGTIQEKDLSQLYCVKLGDSHRLEVLEAVKELKALKEVEFAEPNYKLHTLATISPNYNNNPSYDSQWYLKEYGVKDLWGKDIKNSQRPVIAILDTGVDITHPDLKDNIWTNALESEGLEGMDNDGNGLVYDIHGWDFINNTGAIRDNNKHGTHVAGIAAASDNSLGIIGANPLAYIMPVTVMQSDGTGDVATIIKGINYAVTKGASVLNLSLGTYANSSALRQALENAYQSAVIVAAAGNDFCRIHFAPDCHPGICSYGVMFPAGYSFVLGVQATVQGGSLAGFSNHDLDGSNFSSVSTYKDPDGFNYELKAPGANILSTVPGGRYENLNGTSMAAPLVAGAISALKMVKLYDTQEILWGDLLHSSNILGAYNMTNRPAELDILKVQLQNRKELADETEEDYSGDHEIDAGETVYVYPVIRTTFGEASNIKLKLEMGDEYEDASVIDITTAQADFGWHLDAYGRNVSNNPLVMNIHKDVADGRHIKMKVVATCDESSVSFEKPFVIVVTNQIKINGLISEDMTLKADHTYLVNENLGIMEGATLTIEPGTRVEFMEGMGLSSFGKLVAKGTPEKPIIFTRHIGEGYWAGIKTHESQGRHYHDPYLYTNADQTLFTLLPTEQTPKKMDTFGKPAYYSDTEENHSKSFYLSDYIEDWNSDMTAKQGMLTDPNYLTSAVLQMINDYNAYCDLYAQEYTYEKKNHGVISTSFVSWSTYDNPRDTLFYCRIDGYRDDNIYKPYMEDCDINLDNMYYHTFFNKLSGVRNNIHGGNLDCLGDYIQDNLKYSNIINVYFGNSTANRMPRYSQLRNNNFFNNIALCNTSGKYRGMEYWLAYNTDKPGVDKSDYPSYLGTSREDIVRPYVYEIGNAPNTYGQIDLSNLRTTPIPEAHGIVWKVVVNGKDAQDEFEDLPPLGVGKHKFEVYFNRPMNKAVAPQISFGVRDPYTQQAVAEDGDNFGWNAEGTVYTAYKTITGKTKSDGLNRIYVRGAEDNKFFECPYEKTRFNINVQAAGSMATGFAAEAGLGRVNLTWDNSKNNFEDAMGFNVYRYGSKMKTVPAHYDNNGNWIGETQVPDTVRLNENILDVSAKSFIDYEVTPGETYNYYYKVLSTDLQEYDMSNVVAATPLTSTLGDANGSGDVNVTDVVWTVNYAVGMDPKPFIFEAADVNKDQTIDVLDVVGIVNLAMSASSRAMTRNEYAQAIYTIEDGVLYVETPVTLAGIQVQFAADHTKTMKAAEGLNGFEQASTWFTDNDYMLMAYSFGKKTLAPGKHALLYIGDAELTDIRVSDVVGMKVNVVAGSGTTAIDDALLTKTLNKTGIYNLNGQKVAGNADRKLQRGVYIINGQKVVK